MVTASTTPTSRIAPDNDVVTAEVFIAAPRERVFQAISDPHQAVQWWGQGGKYRLSEFKMDVRVGGKWHRAETHAQRIRRQRGTSQEPQHRLDGGFHLAAVFCRKGRNRGFETIE